MALPLYDPVDVRSPGRMPARRDRPSTVGSEDFRDRSAKLNINLSDDGKERLKPSRFSRASTLEGTAARLTSDRALTVVCVCLCV